jgi:VIT family
MPPTYSVCLGTLKVGRRAGDWKAGINRWAGMRCGGAGRQRWAVLESQSGHPHGQRLGRSPRDSVTGLPGLLTGACSLALGDWVSVTSAREFAQREIRIKSSELAEDAEAEGEEPS